MTILILSTLFRQHNHFFQISFKIISGHIPQFVADQKNHHFGVREDCIRIIEVIHKLNDIKHLRIFLSKYSPQVWSDGRSGREGISFRFHPGRRTVGQVMRVDPLSYEELARPAPPHFAVQSSELRTGSKVRMILDCLPPDRRWPHMLRNTN